MKVRPGGNFGPQLMVGMQSRKPPTITEVLAALTALTSSRSGLSIRANDLGELVIDETPGQLLDRLIQERFSEQEAEEAEKKAEEAEKPKPEEKKPPEFYELEKILLEALQKGPVKANQFYHLWPEGEEAQKRARDEVRGRLNDMLEREKVTKSGHASHTVYTLVKT